MRELRFLTVFPDDAYFTWQCHLWLESLKKIGHSDKAIILIFTPKFREPSVARFQPIIDLYPEAEFKFYRDEHNMSHLLGTYIPILRPYTAWRYWLDYPEMKDKAVFYCDSDILFTEKFNIDHLLEDDIIYCSDTNSYINASYFDSKTKDVLPHKFEDYRKIDVLNEAAKISGINRAICEKNNLHSGGTQYLLKNIDAEYWGKVMTDSIPIIKYLGEINKEFFESESKGFQKWTADMWAVLWALWQRDQETKVVPELNFSWGTDPISRVDECSIYHNAGITGTEQDGHPCFYKGKYHQGSDPTVDPHLDVVLNHEESKKFGTWYYASKLDELRKTYKLRYQ